jgi:glycosyltransferase involved in cell wall biosynthesis
MSDVVIQRVVGEDGDFATHLTTLGFRRIVLEMPSARFMSKIALIWQTMRAPIRLLSRLRTVGKLETVVVLGPFAFLVKALARLHIIHYERLMCSGFFVRSPAWFPVFRLLCRMDTANDHYLIFSHSEIDLYADRLAIDGSRMHYLPPGDWRSTEEVVAVEPANYYFAGGYSNRDYVPVINAFRRIPAELMIVCSALNTELDGLSLPQNITVLRDVSSECFDDYLRLAKAGIVPLKHDTGASGQSVLLRLMRNAKIPIASDIGVVREFIEHGVSGYLVQDMERELPALIAAIESAPAAAARMGQAARSTYMRQYSKSSLAEALGTILLQTSARSGAQ